MKNTKFFRKINSFFQNKTNIHQTSLCLLLSAILVFIGNFLLIKYKFNILESYAGGVNIASFTFEILFNYFFVFLLLYLASFSKRFFTPTIFFIFFISGFSTYILNHYHVIIDQTIISNIIDNLGNYDDVLMFDSIVIYSIFYLLIPFFIIKKFNYKIENNKKTFLIITAIFLSFIIILSFFNHTKRKGIIYTYPPLSLIKSIVSYNNEIGFFRDKDRKLQPINAVIKSKINPKKSPDLKVVLIIGESARSISFSINGYSRNTSPKLSKTKNLLSFKNVLPCDIYTSYSVTCMLSGKGREKFNYNKIDQESIIKIFEKNNFYTTWFSSQKAVGDNNALVNLAREAKKFSFADAISKRIGGNFIYDEYLLPDIDEEIKKKGDDFVMIQTLGSHFLFHERYPEKFEIYQPACKEKAIETCSREEVFNAYDNTIVYTDFIIHSIIEKLKNQNALVIYVSDHGSYLGENGTYYHAIHETMEEPENKVPMFLWMSDSLLKNNFYHKKFLNAKKKLNSKLSHDNLFYSILDCTGIDIEDKKKLSVCK